MIASSLIHSRDTLHTDLRKLSQNAPLADQISFEECRKRLEASIRSFHAKFDSMIEGWGPTNEEDHGPDNEAETNETAPEDIFILMPSCLQHTDIQRLGLVSIAKQEMELRKGQANDALEGLRLAFGHKALLYRSQVRDPWPDA